MARKFSISFCCGIGFDDGLAVVFALGTGTLSDSAECFLMDCDAYDTVGLCCIGGCRPVDCFALGDVANVCADLRGVDCGNLVVVPETTEGGWS